MGYNFSIKSYSKQKPVQMLTTQTESSSIHQLLQLFKHLKSPSNDPKNKDLSALSFSSRNFDSATRNALDSLSIENINNLHIHSRINNKSTVNTSSGGGSRGRGLTGGQNVFDKLYQEKKELQMRKCRLEYQTRRSKEQKQRSQCTFSPNIRSRFRIKTQYDSIENYSNNNNDSFYVKNMQWLERKEKSIRKMQCQKNEENINQLTFTPRINKLKKKGTEINKTHIAEQPKVLRNPGVSDYLQRQQKAKKNQEYIKNRQKNPYSHIWNVKQGHFSYVK